MKTIREMTNRSGTKQVAVLDLNNQYAVTSIDLFTGTKTLHKRFAVEDTTTVALAQAFALAYALRAR